MSRLKHNFEPFIQYTSLRMLEYTDPICYVIDAALAQILTFDTSGSEVYVTENNPKSFCHSRQWFMYRKAISFLVMTIISNVLILIPSLKRKRTYSKITMCIGGRKTRNHTTTKSDVFLAGIASQLTVIITYTMDCPKYSRSSRL